MDYEITEKEVGKTVKEFLKNQLGYSSTLIKKVKFGGLLIDGAAVTVRHVFSLGETFTVNIPDESSENVKPFEMKLDVIYEDEDILVVCKPAGIPTHPSRGNHIPSLAEGVAFYYGDKPFVFRAVNRLDRETSGIVLIAKNELSAYKLSESMKRGEFQKEYLAVVSGVPSPNASTIDAPIYRPDDSDLHRVVDERGKRAVTEYEVLRVCDDGNSLVKLRLHTGRTHQIRVHMAYIGHPLLFDFLYGEEVPGKHFLLHAKTLSFIHPTTGERLSVEAPCPFENLNTFE